MQIREPDLRAMVVSLFIGGICLAALADETHHTTGSSHLVMAAHQGQHTHRAANKEDEHPVDRWLASAMEKESTTTGMRRVTMEAQQKWDQEMNRIYRKLMKRLNSEQRTALLKSQKAWLQYRDAERDAIRKIYIVPEGGTMYLPMADGAWMDRTKQRALELAEFDAVMDEHEGK